MKRLTNFIEKEVLWEKSIHNSLPDFEQSLKHNGSVKEFMYEHNLIIGYARYGLQKTKIEIEAYAIDENKTKITLHGKSDDLGNKGAGHSIERIIETAYKIQSGDALEESFFKRKTGMSVKKIALIIIVFTAVLIAYNGGIRGSVYGTYNMETKENLKGIITLTKDGNIIIDNDGISGWPRVHNTGTFIVSDGKDYIKTSMPPYKIQLTKDMTNWFLTIGETTYKK